MRQLILVLSFLLAGWVWATPTRTEPPYYDPNRSLKQQQEAEKAARDKVKGGQASLDELLAYFSDDSAMVRDAVFNALADQADPKVLEALTRQLGNRDPFVSATVAELLGRCRYEDGRKALEKYGLGSRDEQTALESVWALEAIGSPESASALAKVFKRRKEFRVQGDALIALAKLDPKAAAKPIEHALEDKVPPLRIAGLVALRQVDMQQAVAAAVDVIAADPLKGRQRSWEPRLLFAALNTLGQWTHRAGARELAVRAIDAMIERLKREEGLPQYRLGLALGDLTGTEGIEADAAIWESWWQGRRERFQPQDPQPRGKDQEEAELPSGDGAKGGGARPLTGNQPGMQTQVRFHGIPIHSKRLLFAQDISGGMNNPLDKDADPKLTKMKFAKDELVRVLGALGDDVGTNVVFFATEYYRPAEQLVPLGQNRDKLISFVREQETPDWHQAQNKAKSRSNLYDTLAFSMQDPEIDTIFFLSEGGPNEGRWVDWDRFLEHIRRLNVYQQVEVHTLQITSSKNLTKFLRRLAETTGGTFYGLDALRKAHQQGR